MEELIGRWAVPAGMFGVMLGMGLTLLPDDFRRMAVVPRPVAVGTALQLVGMPIAGLLLARGFGLDPLLSAGLVLIAAAPGGVMSNVLVHLGRADTALSITLTALATTVTLFTIPLWIRAAQVDSAGTPGTVDMPLVETAASLAVFTVLPVAVGMVLRPLWPRLAAREKWITRIGAVVIIAALTVQGVRSDDPPVAALAASWVPALLLLGTAIVMGVGVPLALRLGWRDAATIGVEVTIKNSVLALFVATHSLGSLEAGVPTAVFMTFQVPAAIVVLGLYRFAARRNPP